MRTYTDVPVTITVDGYDMTAATNIHVTFKQGSRLVDVNDVTVGSATSLSLVLTQQQTAMFRAGTDIIEVQLNFIDANGRRKGSEIAALSADDNLLRRILHAE